MVWRASSSERANPTATPAPPNPAPLRAVQATARGTSCSVVWMSPATILADATALLRPTASTVDVGPSSSAEPDPPALWLAIVSTVAASTAERRCVIIICSVALCLE